MSTISTPPRRILQGRVLLITRVVWVVLCLVTIFIFISAVRGHDVYFGDPQRCIKASGVEQTNCLADARALHQFGLPSGYFGIYSAIGVIVEALPMILVGILIFARKSGDLFGILFSLSLVISGTVSFDSAIPYFYRQVWSNYPALGAIGNFMIFLGGVLIVVWYCFPDGHFMPRWTRWLALVWGIQSISFLFLGSPVDIESWSDAIRTGLNYLFALSLLYSLIYRYRRVSDFVQRQQIKWVVASAAVYVLIYVIDPRPFLTDSPYMGFRDLFYTPIAYLSGAILAMGIAFSVLRYRLWDIDIIINRALVYGTFTALVVGVYILVVGVLGLIMESDANWLVAIVATGLVAVLAHPLRDRLQRGVNRMMYGERNDPITVLSRLGQQLETTLAPDALLPSLVKTIAHTLKLPYVAIELDKQSSFEAQPPSDSSSENVSSQTISFGKTQSDLVSYPLVYQAERIGQLLVAPRAVGESFSRMDHHLLENIARQAGMAVHAVSVTSELRQARQRLVAALEEERRRLRRDLHDGLGPALASQGLKLAAAKQLLQSDPDSAASLLDQVMAQNQETVSDVRRLVYGLRPPVLDERGLAEAIRDHVWQDGEEAQGFRLEVGELPAELQSLPAAVEVAAYRIVLEAMTNIIRHAHAKNCTIRFTSHRDESTNSLQIEIVDDGIGLPHEPRAGVGLRSMRERAEELGGKLTVESVPHSGTRVIAWLPLGYHTASKDFDATAAADNREL